MQRFCAGARPQDRDVILCAAEHKTAEVINAAAGGAAGVECGHIDRAEPLHNGRSICPAQVKATPGPCLFCNGGLAFDFLYRPLKQKLFTVIGRF